MWKFLLFFRTKKILVLLGFLSLFLLGQNIATDHVVLAQGCSMESFTIEQDGATVAQGKVAINKNAQFKIKVSGCNKEPIRIYPVPNGPTACDQGLQDLEYDYTLNDGTFISPSVIFKAISGQTCAYRQNDFKQTVTFTLIPGKISCYQYFSNDQTTFYLDSLSPPSWDACDDSCPYVLDLKAGLGTNTSVFSCVDDSVKKRYENCQNSSLTYDPDKLPQCVKDTTLASQNADACNFTFNGEAEPQIDSHRYECKSGSYACLSGSTPSCQKIPKPVVAIPLLQLPVSSQTKILTTTNVAITVDRCVQGKINLYIDGTKSGDSKDSKNGARITFKQKFSTAGVHQIYATCNGDSKSNTLGIRTEDEPVVPFSLKATPKSGETEIYTNHPFTLTSVGCPFTLILDDDHTQSDVGGVPDNDPSVKKEDKYTYTKAGDYTITGNCCKTYDSGIHLGFTTIGASCTLSAGQTSTAVHVVDAGIVDDKDGSIGSCPICPVDWPKYDKNDGLCHAETDYDRYKTPPINTVSCEKGYECVNHAIGCTLPTGGLTPPPQPCKRGIKYVKEEVSLGESITKEVETTDPKEIQKCLELNTAIAGINLDPGGFVQSLLGILLSTSGMIALYLIIRSGYQLMMSRGNPEKIQEARERITSAIVGLLLIIFSLVILSVIGVDLLKIPGFKS